MKHNLTKSYCLCIIVFMTIEIHHPSVSISPKDAARANWLRGHRTQDHGHRGPSHLPTEDEDWVNYAPRRVKAAEQLEDVDSLIGTPGPEDGPAYDGLRKLSRALPKWLTVDPIDSDEQYESYDEEDEKSPLAVDSAEYEAAYDELAELLDRHGIQGEDRVVAVEAFKADPTVQRMLLDQAYGIDNEYLATSFDEVDSSNRLNARSLTDYQVEGTFEDDNGDYHVPHMSVRH